MYQDYWRYEINYFGRWNDGSIASCSTETITAAGKSFFFFFLAEHDNHLLYKLKLYSAYVIKILYW